MAENKNLLMCDWDDRELLAAYEKSIEKTKAALVTYGKHKPDIRHKSSRKTYGKKYEDKWSVGDFCLVESLKDERWFEGQIIQKNEDTCIVRYLGYKMEEEISICDMYPSGGKQAQSVQKGAANWKPDQFCLAPFSGDGNLYEACITLLDDERHCFVKFIGYDDLAYFHLHDLLPSNGEVARAEQRAIAEEHSKQIAENKNLLDWDDEEFIDMYDNFTETVKVEDYDDQLSISSHYSSLSELSMHQNHESELHMPKKPVKVEAHRRPGGDSQQCHHRSSAANHSAPRPCTARRQQRPPSMSPFPIGLHISEDVCLSSMMMSWYMAGYYTGFYEGAHSTSSQRENEDLCRRDTASLETIRH